MGVGVGVGVAVGVGVGVGELASTTEGRREFVMRRKESRRFNDCDRKWRVFLFKNKFTFYLYIF